MDPLSALGVASAAVQFLDFGSSVFSDFKEIYESSSGQSREVVELSTFSDDLARLAGEIEVRLNNARLQKSSRYEKGGSGVAETVTGSEEIFYRLCRSCREIEAEIQQRVAALRATGSNTLKLFTSGFITAIKTVWSENEIRKFKERLYQVRQQMMMTILVHFWSQGQTHGIGTLDELGKALQRIEKHTQEFSADLSHLSGRDRIGSGRREAMRLAKTMLKSELPIYDFTMFELSQATGQPSQSTSVSFQSVVDSLKFKSIDHRHSNISPAYAKTYEWIFQDPPRAAAGEHRWSAFIEWLSNPSDRIYWITGKPGAGKSTLSKFLVQDSRLKLHLRKWAGDSDLILATYFSWNAGGSLQKSIEGFLRTVLYQILARDPQQLVPVVFPSRLAVTQVFKNEYSLPDWSSEELFSGFRLLLQHFDQSPSEHGDGYKLALFVDGLDEFDGQPAALLALLREANRSHRIKICASSRPWNVFRDEFNQSPMLRMEDLTQRDMHLYITQNFEKSSGFRELKVLHPEQAEKLTGDVAEKARGVFLWVSVVVRDLLENLQDGDNLDTLQATLESLPDDLSQLFQVVWDRTNSKYHAEALQYFSLLQTYAARDLIPYALSFWLGGEDVSLELDLQSASDSFVSTAVSALQRKLSSRTKGLLELYGPSGDRTSQVDFMHRTAREWVQENWEALKEKLEPDFDPCLRLLKGETIRMSTDYPNCSWQRIAKLLKAAVSVRDTPANAEKLVQTLDKLDEWLTRISRSGSALGVESDVFNGGKSHWCNSKAEDIASMYQVNFLGLMAQIPVAQYVRFKVEQDPSALLSEASTVTILSCTSLGGYPSSPIYRDLVKWRSNGVERINLLRFLLRYLSPDEAQVQQLAAVVNGQEFITPKGTIPLNIGLEYRSAIRNILILHKLGKLGGPDKAAGGKKPRGVWKSLKATLWFSKT